jgi:hypothetical protein
MSAARKIDWSQESSAAVVAEIERLQATVDCYKKQRLEEPAPVALKNRQAAGAETQKKMTEFLMEYGPARELTIADVHQIAAAARDYAFEAFSRERAG